jgi:hypothetical protein
MLLMARPFHLKLGVTITPVDFPGTRAGDRLARPIQLAARACVVLRRQRVRIIKTTRRDVDFVYEVIMFKS